MDEAMLDAERAMTHFLNLIATDPEIRAPARDDRQLEMGGDRGRPQVPAGQGRRQFDQPEGGPGDFVQKARTIRRYGAGSS